MNSLTIFEFDKVVEAKAGSVEPAVPRRVFAWLPVFDFLKAKTMRLWVLPFCLKERRLKLPDSPELQSVFIGENSKA